MEQLHQPQVANMAAAVVDWEVVLQQTMVALVYSVQAEAEVVSREEAEARTAVHGVTIPPRLAHLEAMEGQGQLLEPQERAETMVLEMAEAEAVLELEEVLAEQEERAVRLAVVVAAEVVEVTVVVLTPEQAAQEPEAKLEFIHGR